ncbi:MAG: hypothetical protein LH606_06925, partial [Cytophagaceae bacterium]|nr:hypothetical protein [Cytophagaceae bacterium]
MKPNAALPTTVRTTDDWQKFLTDICADGDLAKCLLSTGVCEELIHTAHTELGVPKLFVRAVFKLVLIPGVFFVGKAIGSHVSIEKIVPRLLKLPLAATVLSWLGSSLRTKVEDLRRERKLDDLLEGRRTAAQILAEKDPNPEFQVACLTIQEIRELGDALRDLLEPQPLLTIPVEETTHRYHFRRRQVTFRGREAEQRRLEDFVFSQESHSLSQSNEFMFQWWLVTGPGGAGKSRLGLEFCLNLGLTQGRCGFLSSHQLDAFDWENWQPESLTVLVVDYVAGAFDKVLGLVSVLNRRKNSDKPLQNPVRLLLLEREARGTWWERFEADTDARTSCYQRDANGSPMYLPLDSLGETLNWDIVAELHRQAHKDLPDRTETLANLARIDPQGRPLFSVFAGIALVQGQTIRDWNQEKLLQYLLLDEKKVWERAARELHVDS